MIDAFSGFLSMMSGIGLLQLAFIGMIGLGVAAVLSLFLTFGRAGVDQGSDRKAQLFTALPALALLLLGPVAVMMDHTVTDALFAPLTVVFSLVIAISHYRLIGRRKRHGSEHAHWPDWLVIVATLFFLGMVILARVLATGTTAS